MAFEGGSSILHPAFLTDALGHEERMVDGGQVRACREVAKEEVGASSRRVENEDGWRISNRIWAGGNGHVGDWYASRLQQLRAHAVASSSSIKEVEMPGEG